MSHRIGIFLPNWIGDTVMATPFLRAMHQRFGRDAELVGIMKPYVAEVLRGTPWLTKTVLVDSKLKTPSALWNQINALRLLRFDEAVLLTNSFRTGMLAWMSGAKKRIGYARNLRSWLLTTALQPPREGKKWKPISAVDYYLELAYTLGCPKQEHRLELALTQADHESANNAWEKLDLRDDGRVVAFHIAGGWGGTATAKAWPLEYFVDLAKKIVANHEHDVLVLCGPNERDNAREVARRAGHPRVKSLADIESLPLAITKGCLARSQLLVTTDSGPRHIATALDLPVVALYGSIDPRWSETYHPRATTLFNKLDCGPCGKKNCPLGHHRCMRDISVDQVYAAVARQLGQSERVAA